MVTWKPFLVVVTPHFVGHLKELWDAHVKCFQCFPANYTTCITSIFLITKQILANFQTSLLRHPERSLLLHLYSKIDKFARCQTNHTKTRTKLICFLAKARKKGKKSLTFFIWLPKKSVVVCCLEYRAKNVPGLVNNQAQLEQNIV